MVSLVMVSHLVLAHQGKLLNPGILGWLADLVIKHHCCLHQRNNHPKLEDNSLVQLLECLQRNKQTIIFLLLHKADLDTGDRLLENDLFSAQSKHMVHKHLLCF